MKLFIQNTKNNWSLIGIVGPQNYENYRKGNYTVKIKEILNGKCFFENTDDVGIQKDLSDLYIESGWEFYEINSVHNFKEKYPEYFI
jgi:hypothetical protein